MGRKKTSGPLCAVDACHAFAVTRGWCQLHYRRWMEHGTTNPPSKRSLEDRFWANVTKVPDGCWNWTASTRNGYGVIGVHNRHEYAHRMAYMTFVGEIADGLVVRHRCDNRLCVRPDHLELGTHADNSRDMVERGRSPRSPLRLRAHCPKGHPFDEANTYWFDGSRQCRACKSDHLKQKRIADGRAARSNRVTGDSRTALREAVAIRYRDGETLGGIGDSIGRSQDFVRQLLVEAGVAIRTRQYRRA